MFSFNHQYSRAFTTEQLKGDLPRAYTFAQRERIFLIETRSFLTKHLGFYICSTHIILAYIFFLNHYLRAERNKTKSRSDGSPICVTY